MIKIVAVSSVLAAAVAAPTAFYVSSSNPNASDANAGTSPTLPWATLQRAAANVPAMIPGSSLLLRADDVFVLEYPLNMSFPATGGVTLGSYSDDATRTDRPHIARNVTANGAGAALVLINAVNFTLSGLHVSGGEVNLRIAYTAPGSYSGVNILDCELEQARGLAPNASSGNGWGISVQIVAIVQGITVKDVRMSNNLIHDTDTWYLNDILPPPNPLSRTPVLNITVSDNTVVNASYNVLFLDSTQIVNVTRNVFMRDTPRTLFDKGTTDILMGDLNVTFGVTQIVDNEMTWRGEFPGGPDGCAIDFETACGGVLVSNNYISHSYGAGIMVFDHDTRSQGLIIVDNILLYDGCNQTSNDRGEISFMKVNSSGIVANNSFATCPGVPVFHDTVANASSLWTFENNTIDGPGTPVMATPDPVVSVEVTTAGLRVTAAPGPASPPGTLLTYTVDASKPNAGSTPWPAVGYIDLPRRTVAVNVKAFAQQPGFVESATAGGIISVAPARAVM